jgi:hypothetical protein
MDEMDRWMRVKAVLRECLVQLKEVEGALRMMNGWCDLEWVEVKVVVGIASELKKLSSCSLYKLNKRKRRTLFRGGRVGHIR